MASKTVTVPNVSCDHCKMRIEKTLNGLDGIATASVDVASKGLAVEWNDATLGWDAIQASLEKLGYPPEG